MFQNIKPISEKSYKVFSYLADAARNSKNYAIKIKNSETYTPVTVEIIFLLRSMNTYLYVITAK